MPETRRDKQTLLAAIEAGEVPMAMVDRACLRMLELLDKVQRHRRPQTRADFTAHHALAQRLAGESIVLLKMKIICCRCVRRKRRASGAG